MGGWGEAWGGGPWRAGKGGDGGGAPESSVGALKNLTTGLIWLERGWGDGGRRGEVAHGGRARDSQLGRNRTAECLVTLNPYLSTEVEGGSTLPAHPAEEQPEHGLGAEAGNCNAAEIQDGQGSTLSLNQPASWLD